MNKTQCCFPLPLYYLVRLRRDSRHTPAFVRRRAAWEQRSGSYCTADRWEEPEYKSADAHGGI